MANVSSSTTINQPVDQVFATVISADAQKSWQAGILDAKVTPNGPVALGSVYHYTTEVMGRRMETQLQVSAFEPNKKWAVKTTGVPRPVETVYSFEGVGASTKLTISMELTGGYPVAAEAMVKQQMQKSLDDQGKRIKQMLEK
ncbi:MAG: SRPBCC family protein [Chloroflexi bacterium]|nr:SRPBCC family protein [Chloroflexota bacterium]